MLAKTWSNYKFTHSSGESANWYTPLGKLFLHHLTSMMHISYKPAILLGLYPGEMSAQRHQKTCARMFIAPLFLKATKMAKVGQTNKLLYIHTMKFSTAIK